MIYLVYALVILILAIIFLVVANVYVENKYKKLEEVEPFKDDSMPSMDVKEYNEAMQHIHEKRKEIENI